ncbi:DUF6188 family protein [Streptomyces sp. NBC_00233]|uniref:DUF6188 family protein n=1 Tax=Streptomyces sp. NBC_00233 TaxID=2975686 RepID=UPI0022599572|nr:DUF6188 family protein [Streptomyces sp. NBC_00233]MCX5232723.1 DUF6188 family protein [Streptomyces sp. NBC_00233]
MKVPAELVGARVTRAAFDYQVRISFTDHDLDGRVRLDGELVIETPITVTDAFGTRVSLTPGTGTALAPLLGLFTKAVTKAEVTGLGTLSLGFDDGTRLSVDPDPDYESWSLTGSGFEPVLVGPGGEADWPARVRSAA